MNLKKQLIFPAFIVLGMTALSACGGERGSSSTTNNAQNDGSGDRALPEGDNTMGDTTDLRDTSTIESGRDSMGQRDTTQR